MLKDLPKSLIEAAKALKVDVKSNAHSSNLRKREKEIAASHEANVKEETEVTEALKGNQHKIDADKDGKIEKSDFAALRKKKMKEGYVSDAQRKAVWAARNDKKEANEEVQFSDEELARIQEIINGTTDK